MRIAAVVVVGIFGLGSAQQSPQTSDGPFGLWMGATREQVVKMVSPFTEKTAGMLVSANVPRKHPEFESYQLVISRTHGLCSIRAIGANVALNSFGDRLKERFGSTAQALDEKYGSHTTHDFLKAGSIWDDPDDWAMSLLKEERVLSAFWKPESSAAGIEVIMLSAHAFSMSGGYLTHTYQSAQASACIDEVQKPTKSVF